MAKWFGKVGYAITEETEPGLWEEIITERSYFGDTYNDRWKRQNSGEVNDNVTISQTISIIADPFAYQNCSNIAYIEYMGSKWKVSDVAPMYPRLQLTIGGLYNGEQA